MCTALVHQNLFGRTLDLEYSYCERVCVVPRRLPLPFRTQPTLSTHYAILGMAHVVQDYPLFYDAVNEHGLAAAALNFPVSAVYRPANDRMDNIAPFELIAWVLGQCTSVAEARRLLARANLTKLDFRADLPATPLHWLIAGRDGTIAAEPLSDGLHVCDNPVGVLTNEPPFAFQIARLTDCLSLSARPPENRLCPTLPLTPYSRGMGALGLPGDWSSPSRFVRAAFASRNSLSPSGTPERISQFFHLMSCVEVPRGCVVLEDGTPVTSVYTSCCDLERIIYHYTTYENRQISAVDLHREDLDGDRLISYPLLTQPQIRVQNG